MNMQTQDELRGRRIGVLGGGITGAFFQGGERLSALEDM